MNFKIVLTILYFVFYNSLLLSAQEREVKGKVTTFGEVPLENVVIVLKYEDKEILTDEEGNFSFVCDENEKITFNAHGFFSKKVKVANYAQNESINVDLPFKKGKKNFEVATGYGHINKDQLSYAIEHLDSGPDYSAYRNILEAIEGKISGIQVSNSAINIRGTATLSGGPTPALLVVDGTVVEFPVFANIPPVEVKSIDILKGAAASARYGSRGMGGVVIVKTKTNN